MNIVNPSKKYENTCNLVYSCQYHVIFCPKYRRPVLLGKIKDRLKEIIAQKQSEYNYNIIEIEILSDHVHLLISVNPKIGIHSVVTKIKGSSSRILREEFPELKSNISFTGTAQARNTRYKEMQLDFYAKQIKEKAPNMDDKLVERMAKRYVKSFKVKSNVWAKSLAHKEIGGITLNKARFTKSQLETTKTALKSDVLSKYHPEGTESIKAILDHELGHQIDDLIGLNTNPRIVEVYSRYTNEELTDKLSTYAWSNNNKTPRSEFIAEAWSEYRNNPKPRELAKEVGKIIEEEYKKWKK